MRLLHWHEVAQMGVDRTEPASTRGPQARATGCGCAGAAQGGPGEPASSASAGGGRARHWHDFATREPAAPSAVLGLRPRWWRV